MEKGTCNDYDVSFNLRATFTKMCSQQLVHLMAGDKFLRIEGE